MGNIASVGVECVNWKVSNCGSKNPLAFLNFNVVFRTHTLTADKTKSNNTKSKGTKVMILELRADFTIMSIKL